MADPNTLTDLDPQTGLPYPSQQIPADQINSLREGAMQRIAELSRVGQRTADKREFQDNPKIQGAVNDAIEDYQKDYNQSIREWTTANDANEGDWKEAADLAQQQYQQQQEQIAKEKAFPPLWKDIEKTPQFKDMDDQTKRMAFVKWQNDSRRAAELNKIPEEDLTGFDQYVNKKNGEYGLNLPFGYSLPDLAKKSKDGLQWAANKAYSTDNIFGKTIGKMIEMGLDDNADAMARLANGQISVKELPIEAIHSFLNVATTGSRRLAEGVANMTQEEANYQIAPAPDASRAAEMFGTGIYQSTIGSAGTMANAWNTLSTKILDGLFNTASPQQRQKNAQVMQDAAKAQQQIESIAEENNVSGPLMAGETVGNLTTLVIGAGELARAGQAAGLAEKSVKNLLTGTLSSYFASQSFANTYQQATMAYMNQGADFNTASQAAIAPAAFTGIADGALFLMTDLMGKGKIFNFDDAVKLGDRINLWGRTTGLWGGQAMGQTIVDSMIAKQTYNPDLDMSVAFKQSLVNAGIGALTVGALTAPMIFAPPSFVRANIADAKTVEKRINEAAENKNVENIQDPAIAKESIPDVIPDTKGGKIYADPEAKAPDLPAKKAPTVNENLGSSVDDVLNLFASENERLSAKYGKWEEPTTQPRGENAEPSEQRSVRLGGREEGVESGERAGGSGTGRETPDSYAVRPSNEGDVASSDATQSSGQIDTARVSESAGEGVQVALRPDQSLDNTTNKAYSKPDPIITDGEKSEAAGNILKAQPRTIIANEGDGTGIQTLSPGDYETINLQQKAWRKDVLARNKEAHEEGPIQSADEQTGAKPDRNSENVKSGDEGKEAELLSSEAALSKEQSAAKNEAAIVDYNNQFDLNPGPYSKPKISDAVPLVEGKDQGRIDAARKQFESTLKTADKKKWEKLQLGKLHGRDAERLEANFRDHLRREFGPEYGKLEGRILPDKPSSKNWEPTSRKTVAEWKNKYKLNGRASDAMAVLEKMAETPMGKSLAKLLVRYMRDTQIIPSEHPTRKGYRGVYDRERNSIELNLSEIKSEKELQQVLLHEGLHKAVSDFVDQGLNNIDKLTPLGRERFNALRDVFDEARQKIIGDKPLVGRFLDAAKEDSFFSTGNNSDMYGLTDMHEFVSELMTNPRFQDALHNIKSDKAPTMWNRVVDAIRKFFGFEPESLADKGMKKVLDLLDNPEPEMLKDLYGHGDGKFYSPTVDVAEVQKKTPKEIPAVVKNIIAAKRTAITVLNDLKNWATGWEKETVAQGIMRDLVLDKVIGIYKAGKLYREIVKALPDADVRQSIPFYLEAAGNMKILEAWSKDKVELTAKYSKRAMELTPEQRRFADGLAKWYADMRQKLIDRGIDIGSIDNYVNHIWAFEKLPASERVIGRRSAHRARMDAQKARKFSNFAEGMREYNHIDPETGVVTKMPGLTPRSLDIADLVWMYHTQANELLASNRMVKRMLSTKGEDGRPLASIAGIGTPRIMGKSGELKLYFSTAKGTEFSDYRFVDHPAFKAYKFVDKLGGVDITSQNHIIFNPEVAKNLENSLKLNFIANWYYGGAKTEGGVIMKDALRNADQFINMTAKSATFAGLSAFHLVQETTHFFGEHGVFNTDFAKLIKKTVDTTVRGKELLDPTVDPVLAEAIYNGLNINISNPRGLWQNEISGNRKIFEDVYTKLAKKALNFAGKKLPPIERPAEFATKALDGMVAANHWLFETYIPLLKDATYRRVFPRYLKAYEADMKAGKVTRNEVSALAATHTNWAYGHLDYSFANPNAMTILQRAFLAPDFLMARIRYFASGVVGSVNMFNGKEGAQSTYCLFRMFTQQYLVCRALNALFNQGDMKMDFDDAFAVKIGNNRYTFRAILPDAVEFHYDPRSFISGRLSPLGRALLEVGTGKNYRGEKMSINDWFRERVQAYVPIMVQPWVHLSKTAQESSKTMTQQFLGTMGLKIQRDTPDMKMYKIVDRIAPKKAEFPPSGYRFVKYALQGGNDQLADYVKANKEFDKLLSSGQYKNEAELEKKMRDSFSKVPSLKPEEMAQLSEKEKEEFKAGIEYKKQIKQRLEKLIKMRRSNSVINDND